MSNFGAACRKCIDSGVCKADCCGVVPFFKDFYLDNIDKLQCKVVELVPFGSDEVYPGTEDLQCCFMVRDSSDKSKLFGCAVYEDRPEVCRLYGTGARDDLLCPHLKPSGNLRSPASKKQVLRKLDVMFEQLKSGKMIKAYGRK